MYRAPRRLAGIAQNRRDAARLVLGISEQDAAGARE
jgi:hypothetical protein